MKIAPAKMSHLIALSALLALLAQVKPVHSQTSVVSESSSSSTSSDEVVKGYAFKYKERFRNYAEQIDNAQTKGWLNSDSSAQFKSRLEELRTQEASAGKNGYPKGDVDTLDQAVTKFNMDLTNAEQKK